MAVNPEDAFMGRDPNDFLRAEVNKRENRAIQHFDARLPLHHQLVDNIVQAAREADSVWRLELALLALRGRVDAEV